MILSFMNGSYHTQHSPFGAFASFTLGLHSAPGGFGQSLGGPARQNIYIGWRKAGDSRWTLLPFFKSTQSLLATFTGEEATAECKDSADGHYRLLQPGAFTRQLDWASDTWKAADLTFSLHTPFDRIPELSKLPALRQKFLTAPVVSALLTYDNRDGKSDVEVIFGMNEPAQPVRPIADTAKGLLGFATVNAYGYATPKKTGVRPLQGLSVLNQEFADPDGYHRIGAESALVFRIPAGKSAAFPLTLGFFQAGMVTTGIPCSFYYTRFFKSLEDVLTYGLKQHNSYVKLARKRDAELQKTKLSPEQKFLIAQSTHSYLGSTQLLDRKGKPLWVVNEGEYRMMNTFDLTVDHLFFELDWLPWGMRNALDLFISDYSYTDTIHTPEGKKARGGLSFTHDMGVANQFSPRGYSSYECTNLHGCFSHMTSEQLVNWVLCAVTYGFKNKDLKWLRSRASILAQCAHSMQVRDNPDPRLRTGIISWDSDRCGAAGSEITTYDSLDVSLGQSRNNLYLAVKTLAAWLLLERAWTQLGRKAEARTAAETADLLIRTLCSKFEDDTGFFPAVFEKGNKSRILPAVEGLVFPLYLGFKDLFKKGGRLDPLLQRLETHMKNALVRGICIDADSGGWKISSTSHNTWFSKIAIAQHVTRVLFPLAVTAEAARGDAVHAAWETGPGCADMAMCDQINSRTGQAIGSKYYPRGVTAILWMKE
jgi:hypothetical protein